MSIFIGDTVSSFNSDPLTKVANSITECNLEFYGQDLSDVNNIPVPTDSSWTKNTTQSDLDKIKILDSVVLTKTTSSSSKTRGLLIKCDYSALCTSLFGGSNSAFKSSILNTSSTDLYAIGQGSNTGVSTYGLVSKIWNGSAWVSLGSNTNNTIQKTTRTFDNTYLTTDNKIFIVLHSTYASDATISSSISIDFLNIKLDTAKIADVITAIPVVL